jgi:DNA-binding beta-propeller fold protein YncE
MREGKIARVEFPSITPKPERPWAVRPTIPRLAFTMALLAVIGLRVGAPAAGAATAPNVLHGTSATAALGLAPSNLQAQATFQQSTGPRVRVQHLEYVFNDGLVSVYDMDQGQKLVKTISLPQTRAGIRGATVAPVTHMLFVSYGGDGGGNGNGSVLAYDLVAERVVWTVHLHTGIDSGAVSPDGKRLYMPTGENTSSGIWNVLDTSSGAIVGTVRGWAPSLASALLVGVAVLLAAAAIWMSLRRRRFTIVTYVAIALIGCTILYIAGRRTLSVIKAFRAGVGAHNTVVSNDGRYVYLGGRNYNHLQVYDATTGHVRGIGPLRGGVRPFTVNGSNTLAFTTATGFDGFQVSSITSGKVLFTVSFGSVPSAFPFSAPSHGVSLSPDGKELYVIDSVHKAVRVYDVSKVSQGVAPTRFGVIRVDGLNGNESPCAYDCGQDGWLQHSLDGRFVYVGDSGEVIDTATRKVLTTLATLANTRKSLEIDWANGVPIATSGRTGVGQVG